MEVTTYQEDTSHFHGRGQVLKAMPTGKMGMNYPGVNSEGLFRLIETPGNLSPSCRCCFKGIDTRNEGCMKRLSIAVTMAFTLFMSVYACAQQDSELFRLSFENFNFLEDEYVQRSGFKTAEDRGLELVEGRYGQALLLKKNNRFGQLDEMTGTDLDLATAVAFNTRHRMDQWDVYNEPFFWGFGKCSTKSGAVAFWIKGDISEGMLFEQSAMAWGRKEKFLIAITINENKQLGAYLTDSRYVRHEITGGNAWNPTEWNHVVLNWDMANGLELFLNGRSVASSWGSDSWWETPLPGLFHLPMPHVAYDEFALYGHPLDIKDIASLMEFDRLPEGRETPARTIEERGRVASALGLTYALSLPAATPYSGSKTLVFKEIDPTHCGDENIPGLFCRDGRYELAWPHQIATFTIIPGDADFQAEKLEIETAPDTPFNYITLEGNTNGLPTAFFDAERKGDTFTGVPFFDIVQNGGFFFGTSVERKAHRRFTLPFVKGYGAPGEFEGDVRLPLTGETRLHEIGLFDVTESNIRAEANDIRFDFTGVAESALSGKSGKSLLSTSSAGSRRILTTGVAEHSEKAQWHASGYLERMNIMLHGIPAKTAVKGILLDLRIRTKTPEDILLVRLHDPALPHRIWTHAELKLRNFETANGGQLRVYLEAPAFILGENDTVWIDISTLDNAEIRTGNADNKSGILLKTTTFDKAKTAYEAKAILPAQAEFTKAYHHRPWIFEKSWPDIDNPRSLGGQFDSVMPALAVQRILPDSFLAGFYADWATEKYYWGGYSNPEKNFPIKAIEIPNGVPRWAWLQKRMQDFRYRVTDFLIENQQSDGQIWGGWNDDTLILRGRPDLPLDGNEGAKNMYLKVYEGLDRTRIFEDGFCQIHPIDNLHNGDFVRERFRAVLFNLGDPVIFRRAMRTAWRWKQPFQTPYNWGNGKPFMFAKNILDWYWGKNVPHQAWQSPAPEKIDADLSRAVSYMDENMYHRYTSARVHTDNNTIFNESVVKNMILGGDASASISVAWPSGGGKDMARWVTYADSTNLTCKIYSFDKNPRNLTARLCRIEYGDYIITLSEDNGGTPGKELFSTKKRLRRFDTFNVSIPPEKEVLLTVKQRKRRKEPEQLPDLAVAAEDCHRENNTLAIRICNVGDGWSKKSTVLVLNAEGKKEGTAKLEEIDPSDDFVIKYRWVEINDLPRTGALTVVIDPGDKITEIFEGNNSAVVE